MSSSFIMCMGEEILIYADCAVIPNPDASALAHIAISSAKSATDFGINPKVALLSYATGNSSAGSDPELVKEAKKLINELEPELKV
ncbi:phosphate acyltransferase, partial [Campylobacter sp. MOP51]|uniref:phosphate acyltransferase n=1 Tax=Campylobacter canis TaxID=3378588 RepID=UPI003C435122